MARRLTVTRADVQDRYPDLEEPFVPTHRVRVLDPRSPTHVLCMDYVRLGSVGDRGVRYAYGPDPSTPLYGVLSTGLWQSFQIHGRVEVTSVRYDADYVPLQEREGLVYFIQAGTEGAIKVGWTQNVDRRIAELQTANAQKLVLLATLPGTMETEASLHARFSHLRLEAEWFRNSHEIHDFLRDLAVNPL